MDISPPSRQVRQAFEKRRGSWTGEDETLVLERLVRSDAFVASP
jgi:hypothetical protein